MVRWHTTVIGGKKNQNTVYMANNTLVTYFISDVEIKLFRPSHVHDYVPCMDIIAPDFFRLLFPLHVFFLLMNKISSLFVTKCSGGFKAQLPLYSSDRIVFLLLDR